MFNNKLWTSKPPISRWSAGRRWCEWCYRYRHRRYDYERYEKRSETLVATERSRRSPSAANACFLVERTSSPCGMSALGHKQTLEQASKMSALPPRADSFIFGIDVR